MGSLKQNIVPDEEKEPEMYMDYIFKLLHNHKNKLLQSQLTEQRMDTYALLRECCCNLEIPGYFNTFKILCDFAEGFDDYSATATDAFLALWDNKKWISYIGRSDRSRDWGIMVCKRLINLGAEVCELDTTLAKSFLASLTENRIQKVLCECYNNFYKSGNMEPNYKSPLWYKYSFFSQYLEQNLCLLKNSGQNVFDLCWKTFIDIRYPNKPIFTEAIVPQIIEYLKDNRTLASFKMIHTNIVENLNNWGKSRFYDSSKIFYAVKTIELVGDKAAIPLVLQELIKNRLDARYNNQEIICSMLDLNNEYKNKKAETFAQETNELKTKFSDVLVDFIILPYL